uniref:ORF1 n=1 Tax=Malaco herpesvirus 1 TaxID=3031797 RepID=A0AA48P830_9VIRU|nr:TPA_asm: ORF1 [Malaco herpesvirus 1]
MKRSPRVYSKLSEYDNVIETSQPSVSPPKNNQEETRVITTLDKKPSSVRKMMNLIYNPAKFKSQKTRFFEKKPGRGRFQFALDFKLSVKKCTTFPCCACGVIDDNKNGTILTNCCYIPLCLLCADKLCSEMKKVNPESMHQYRCRICKVSNFVIIKPNKFNDFTLHLFHYMDRAYRRCYMTSIDRFYEEFESYENGLISIDYAGEDADLDDVFYPNSDDDGSDEEFYYNSKTRYGRDGLPLTSL